MLTSRLCLRVATPARVPTRALTSSTGYTISEVVCKDHRELEAYYHKMLSTSSYDVKERYRNQFSWQLAKHMIGEEIVLYPAFEKYLGTHGKAAADQDRQSHQKIKDSLEYFQRVFPQSYQFEPKLRELMCGLSEHVEVEEKTQLPELEEALRRQGGKATFRLARSFRRTQFFVPTRSHPWMPNKPPFETLMGLLSAPVDTLGNIFRKFPDDEDLGRVEEEYMREYKGGKITTPE